jgi:hypothetical protein
MSAVSTLHQIVYVSTAHRAFSHDELQSLLVECRANNQEHGITGMLLYHDGGFIQALEGQKADVLHVYDRIFHDSRHRCIIKPLERSVERRNFPHWKMGFQNLDAKTINLPGFTRFLQEPSPRREIRDELDLSLQLLFSFKESGSQPVA